MSGNNGLKVAAKVTAAAITLIAGFEGYRAYPYKDQAGVLTDGYGNTHNVVAGQPVTKEQALKRLGEHVEVFQTGVLKCLGPRIPSDGQLIAFTSLAYNSGLGVRGRGGFCVTKDGKTPSKIVRLFKVGDDAGACAAILEWVNVNGKFSQGLYNRREKEFKICVSNGPSF